jgi:glutathione S-transferase
MSYTLILGQKNYSSWSMRAWMLLRTLGIAFDEITVPLYQDESRAAVQALGGQTGLVPVLLDGETAIWDTLAIFEYLHENYPTVWPADRSDRAHARSICSEIHSEFHALRSAMPVNTRARGRAAVRSAKVAADIDRVVEIWIAQSSHYPWLFGTFSGADIMFAPIATRFQTYDVQLKGRAAEYCGRLLEHPLVTEWLGLGQMETSVIPVLEIGIL